MHKSRLAGFIIDCKDADLTKAAMFWSQALGMQAAAAEDNGYVSLLAQDRDLQIAVQKVSHENRVHLDIETDDVEAEVTRLEQLGARRIEQRNTNAYLWWIMEAPTGHRFCVVQGKFTMDQIQIRPLENHELAMAFPIVRQLRTHLSFDVFSARYQRQRDNGYQLIGLFDGSVLIGVLGMRPVETLSRGPHLHVDDLVVDQGSRGLDYGKKLLSFAESYAKENHLNAVFLDSRQEVISFYEHLGYQPHTALLMRKRVLE